MRFKITIVFCISLLIACAHLKEAETASKNRDYEKAIQLCRTAIQQDSGDVQAWLILSEVYIHMDSMKQSLNILSNLPLKNQSRKVKNRIIGQYWMHAEKAVRPEKTIEYLLLAEQTDSMHIATVDTLAFLFDKSGQYNEAKRRYNRLIDIAKNPLSYMNRVNAIENRQAFATDEYEKGMKALRAGRKKPAEEHLGKAARTDPWFTDAVYRYGMLAGSRLYKEGHQEALEEAILLLNKAVKVKPEDLEAHYLLAKVCERKGQSSLGMAIHHYQRVIQLAPKSQYAKTAKTKIKKLKKRKAFWEKGKH